MREPYIHIWIKKSELNRHRRIKPEAREFVYGEDDDGCAADALSPVCFNN